MTCFRSFAKDLQLIKSIADLTLNTDTPNFLIQSSYLKKLNKVHMSNILEQ